jgi:hypothetical protein
MPESVAESDKGGNEVAGRYDEWTNAGAGLVV